MASKKRRTTRSNPSFYFTAPSRSGWREPEVKLGEPKPIPESRPEVLAKILAKLEAQPEGFRQDYSNGEFISSSLCIAKTFEACKKVRTLDTNSYTVHHDEKNGLFWRHGGFFD